MISPIARVRPSLGRRPVVAGADAPAAALRSRFEQLLHAPADVSAARGVCAEAQTPSEDAAPTSLRTDALQPGSRTAPRPIKLDAGQGIAASSSQALASAPSSALSAREAATTPVVGVPMQAALSTAVDALRADAAAHEGNAPRSNEPLPAMRLEPPALECGVAGRQRTAQQLPAPHTTPAAAAQKDLPELVRDLVQTVVHLCRGREGQWRLTMALKPQVLEGTVVELAAQPGRLHVSFDCAGADACARLTAARRDLHQRLGEALSAVRPVDVHIDVRIGVQTSGTGGDA